MTDHQTKTIFTSIYQNSQWGQHQDKNWKFYSGPGSHDPMVTSPYIDSILNFLDVYRLIIGEKPNVSDLGCGDFAIGSLIRPFCNNYIAADIVEDLIEYNKEKFKNLHCDWLVCDLDKDPLPKGDIAFVRQVFQHLTNHQIQNAVEKIKNNFSYLIVTEHLPDLENFTPNIEIPNIGNWRVGLNSGVVLTEPPFNLKKDQEKVLCSVIGDAGRGIIRTTLHKLD